MRLKYLHLFLVFCFCHVTLISISQTQKLDSLLEQAFDNRRSDYLKADSLVHWIIDFSAEIGDQEIYLKALKDAGSIHMANGNYKKAEQCFSRAAQAADSLNDLYWQSKINIEWARNLSSQNRQTECLEKGLKSLEQAKQTNDTVLIIKTLAVLADLSRMTQSTALAMNYNEESIRLAWTIKDSSLLIRCYNNLSTILGLVGRNNEAIDTLKRALSFIKENNYFGKGKLNSNIAFAYRNLEEYDSALVYNRRSLAAKRKVNDIPGIGFSFDAIGRCYTSLGQNDSALYYMHNALDTAIKYRDVYRIKDIYVHLADAYEAAGLFKEAYGAYRQGKSMDDSLYTVEVAEKVRLLERQYSLSEKEREIEKLDTEKKLSSSRNQLLFILILAITGVAALLIGLLYYRNRSKERQHQLAEAKLKSVEQENENNKRALIHFVEDLQLKNRQLKSLNHLLYQKEDELAQLTKKAEVGSNELVDFKILTEEDWERFKKLFSKVNPHFFEKLKALKYDFTKGEKRLMALIRLELNNSEIADALGISSESVSKSKFRLKGKLGLEKDDSLNAFVHTV